MTPDELRQLEGPALTKLAWELGLAPAGVTWEAGCAYAYDEETEQAWRPWNRIAQADAVFRGLRALGWSTTNDYRLTEATGRVGAYEPATGRHVFAHYNAEHSEAHAMLLVSCLTVTSDQEVPDGP